MVPPSARDGETATAATRAELTNATTKFTARTVQKKRGESGTENERREEGHVQSVQRLGTSRAICIFGQLNCVAVEAMLTTAAAVVRARDPGRESVDCRNRISGHQRRIRSLAQPKGVWPFTRERWRRGAPMFATLTHSLARPLSLISDAAVE